MADGAGSRGDDWAGARIQGEASGHGRVYQAGRDINVYESTRAGPGDVEYTAAALAQMVELQWKEEAALRSLDDPDPIPVQWRLLPDLSDHPVSIDPGAVPSGAISASGVLEWEEASSSDVSELARRFRGTRRRRLVIVGGPGSGKTTLAVQLLLQLLKTRVEGEPVPVLLPIAGWDTTRFPRLHDWLENRLPRDYPALRSAEYAKTVHVLIAGGLILPVLDGLDELPPTAQAEMITALNRSLGGSQLILTSRTSEFQEAVETAGRVITSTAVLQAESLSPAQAADYLRLCLPRNPRPAWRQILDGLDTAPPAGPDGPSSANEMGRWSALAGITSTPLGVWLLRAVYTAPGADPAELTDPDRFPDAAALRAHLFDQLIPALITARPPSSEPAEPFRPRRDRNPADTRRYLAYLAHLLTHPRNQDGTPRTRDLAWWHIARHVSTRRQAGLTAGLMAALTAGLTAMSFFGLDTRPEIGLRSALAFGPVFGLVSGLVGWFKARRWAHDEPGFADLRLHNRGGLLIRRLASGLISGLPVGLAVGLVPGLVIVLTNGIGQAFGLGFASDRLADVFLGGVAGLVIFGPVGWLAGGLVRGLVKWMETPASAARASTPQANWRADRTLNLTRILTFGLVAGLVAGLVFGLVAVLANADALARYFVSGLLSGLAVGLSFALAFGRYRAWMAYVVAVGHLARRKVLPRDLMRFLDDAHRLGLLRAVGPIYQFRHAELQDHLAATYQPRS